MKKRIKKILLGILCLLLISSLLMLLFRNSDKQYKFDLDMIQKNLLDEYKELNLRALDQYDVSMYFGIDYNDIPSSIFLSDYVENPEKPQAFSPKILIVVINTEDAQKYYDLLYDFLDVNKNNIEDKEKLKIYETAILKSEKKYVYLVMGDKPKNIEKRLLELQKSPSTKKG